MRFLGGDQKVTKLDEGSRPGEPVEALVWDRAQGGQEATTKNLQERGIVKCVVL